MAAGLSPTHQFLLDCVGSSFGASARLSATTAIERQIDWAQFLELSSRHNLSALIQAGLSDTQVAVPAGVRDQLQANSVAATLHNECIVEPNFRAVLRILHDTGLDPIVLKGPALAYTVYTKPEHRSFADIDLLLLERELRRADEVLCQHFLAGSTVQPRLRQASASAPNHHLSALVIPGRQLEVELHRHLIPEPHPYAIDLGRFWRRAVMSDVAGIEVRLLAPEDELFLACLHLAYAHGYRRYPLRNLADVLALATHYANRLDWKFFVEITQRARARGAVFWPLYIARIWLGAPIPDKALSSLAPRVLERRLVGAFVDPAYLLEGDIPEDEEVLYRLLIQASLYSSHGIRSQMGAVFRAIHPANTSESNSRLAAVSHLANPKRSARGFRCAGQLIRRLASR